ncbi:MAG: redoxin domain-containing protein [Candidatus Rokubacteria bacterium]|nr:redoxin domain-containing protein [Candidatus Rokubacteria bacterium]
MRRLVAVVLGAALVIGLAIALTRGPEIQNRGAAGPLLSELGFTVLDRTPAPDFTVERLDGGRLALADLRGHVALIYFWATW